MHKGKRYLPAVAKGQNRYPVSTARNQASRMPIANINSFFGGSLTKIGGDCATKKGRIHAQMIERKAVLIDANGNKMMLSESQNITNTPETFRGKVTFTDRHGRGIKNRHRR